MSLGDNVSGIAIAGPSPADAISGPRPAVAPAPGSLAQRLVVVPLFAHPAGCLVAKLARLPLIRIPPRIGAHRQRHHEQCSHENGVHSGQ